MRLHVPGTLSGGRVALGTLGLAAALLGCTDGSGANPFAEAQQGIIKGELSEAKDDAVIGVVPQGKSCTGTLIAPTVVLTALHCVSEYDINAPFACTAEGELDDPGSPGGKLGALLEPSQVKVGWGVLLGEERILAKRLVGTGAPDVCSDDLAVVVLETAPDIGAPLVSLRFDRPTTTAETVRAAGYGTTGASVNEPGRHERSGVRILGVGAPSSGTTGDKGIAPRTILTGEGPCSGDSGGPLFSEETGAQIGVYSLIYSETCGGSDASNSYTQVAPFAAFISDILEEEGYEPIVEPPLPGTGGVPGQAGETGMGGEPGEGGAQTGVGGDVATGGATGGGAGTVGGTGGTGNGGSAAGGSGGSSATGGSAGTETGGSQGTGSGSRRDPSCTCRAAGSAERSSWSLAALLAGALGLMRRRRAQAKWCLVRPRFSS